MPNEAIAFTLTAAEAALLRRAAAVTGHTVDAFVGDAIKAALRTPVLHVLIATAEMERDLAAPDTADQAASTARDRTS